MESNGLPWKIQVSESTAKVLIQSGKKDWLQPREETIEAKGKANLAASIDGIKRRECSMIRVCRLVGKGEMQTYWLEIKDEGSVLMSEETSSIAPSLSAVRRTNSVTGPSTESESMSSSFVETINV
jgi:hypothetical protein